MLPFLTIMLGLMSVMALTTMSISVQKREEAQKEQVVELTGVPSGFRPFHIRCSSDRISWLDYDGEWHATSIYGLISMLRGETELMNLPQNQSLRLLAFLRNKTAENAKLSFLNQQNTLILWVEPEGIEAAQMLQYIIGDMGMPLRIGKLPIFEGEEIRYSASLP